ncbi:cupredoxin domain-containing protein [Nitrosopumilus sp. S4]
MAGIDRAAIAFTIAITAIGAGFAFVGDSVDYSPPAATTAPKVMQDTTEPKAQADPFADIAAKVKDAPKQAMDEVKEEVEDVAEDVADVVEDFGEVIIEETKEMVSGPETHKVDIPVGTSVPGCEETNACYAPADITIKAGDTVEWVNVDTAAHTVTGGSPADGPSGVFDSSLVMANANYAFTFDKAGSYDYFCMVHPWMVGSVTVN